MSTHPDAELAAFRGLTSRDERLGAAVEAFVDLAGAGAAPDPDAFAARFPDLRDDLKEALRGLALMRSLAGVLSGPGPELESGRRVAGYRIVRELGRGGMGVVYEAVHVDLDRPVALKILDGRAAPDSAGRRRFLNEARIAARLHHTHIVPIFDVGEAGGLCYYAMQRIEGSGLDRVLRRLRRDPATADDPPPFDPPPGSNYYRWVAEVGRMAAEALAFAHQHGVIHRDVKPSNLLVDTGGTVWMTDFGLARRLSDPDPAHPGSLGGTLRYMSPEQSGAGPVDRRTDIFSLGATLYELLTLRPAFPGEHVEDVTQARDLPPTAPRIIDPKVPRDLEAIILKALGKRPADRYADAADLAEDLGRFLRWEPVGARRIGPLGRLLRAARRHPLTTAVTTAATAVVLAVAAIAHLHVVRERDEAVRSRAAMHRAWRWTVAANQATQAALRVQYWREASSVRLSSAPNRRATGLGLVQAAAALNPDPTLGAQLRNEAVELLSLRDVVARPGLATEGARSLAFVPRGGRIAVFSEVRDEFRLSLWDVAGRTQLAEHRLGVGRRRSVEGGAPTPEPSRRGRRGDSPRRGPRGPRLAVAGTRLLVALPDGGGFRLLDAATGAPLRDVATEGRRVVSIQAAPATRPDRFVTAEMESPRAGRSDRDRPPTLEVVIRLWDLGPNQRDPRGAPRPLATLDRWSAAAPVPPLADFDPDGRTIATARAFGETIALWSADDGAPLGRIEAGTDLTALAIGPRGQLAAAGEGAVRLWDLATGDPRPSINIPRSPLRLLRFSARGHLLAAAGRGNDAELWDTEANRLVAVLPTPDRLTDFAFAPDDSALAIADVSGRVAVWALIEPEVRVRLGGVEDRPRGFAFRRDGLLAVASGNGRVRFWRPGSGLAPHLDPASDPSPPRAEGAEPAPTRGPVEDPSPDERPEPERPISLAFDDRGRLLAPGPQGLRVWTHPEESEASFTVPWPKPPVRGRNPRRSLTAPWMSLVDRQAIVFARQRWLWTGRPGDPEPWRMLRPPQAGSGRPVDADTSARTAWRTLAVAPGGERLFLLDATGAAHAWQLGPGRDGMAEQEWVLPGGAVSLALSPDGRTVAVCDRTRGVLLIDAQSGTARVQLAPKTGGAATQARILAFSPDGRDLAVGTARGPIQLWRVDAPSTPPLRLPCDCRGTTALAFDFDGRYLAAGMGKLVDVWDLVRLRSALARLGLGW